MTDFHVYAAGRADTVEHPKVRHIEMGDLYQALLRGIDDFRAKPSHVIFIALIYPIVGVVLARWTAGADAPHMIFPLMSGFALIGPFAALGLYEISRRRELGLETSWRQALDVRHSPALPGIAVLGLALIVFLLVWLFAAEEIYRWTFGADRPVGLTAFVTEVLTTERGWLLIVVGMLVGFVFAAVVLSLTVVAFPMMLDRDCGVVAAVETSVNVARANPGPIAAWGLIVAAGLVLGSIPIFAGLAVVMPILGHATWHLYRRTVEAEQLRKAA